MTTILAAFIALHTARFDISAPIVDSSGMQAARINATIGLDPLTLRPRCYRCWTSHATRTIYPETEALYSWQLVAPYGIRPDGPN